MDEQTAKLIIGGGAAVGVAFWCLGIWLYRAMAGAETRQKFEGDVAGVSPAEAIRRLVANSQVVDAQSKAERAGDDRLTVSRSNGIELSFEATRVYDGAHVVATVDDSRRTRRYLLGLGAFVLILMPAVIGGLSVALWHLVAPHPTLAIRAQSVQIVQIVHVLWPPLLFYFLWKHARRGASNAAANALVLAQLGER